MRDQQTRDALEGAITHWEENLAAETPSAADVRSDACALCDVFANGLRPLCQKCPVFARTGRVGCMGSPWIGAYDRFKIWALTRKESDMALWRLAARAELDFLISLRESVDD